MASDDLLFNPRGLRHYRRTYSRLEWKLSLVVAGVLIGILGWVQYKGAHPDPALFANSADLLDPGRSLASRGALPEGLAPPDWRETGLAQFDADNVYKKIDGRADYFKDRGFVELTFLTLAYDKDPSTFVDVEFYDLGATKNSFGAYAGEKSEGAVAEQAPGAIWHYERNALFLARGKYYVRAIGSVESQAVKTALDHIRLRLMQGLVGGERPWAHVLFVDGLGKDVGDIAFQQDNAFSFDFARDVYSVGFSSGAGDDTELFVTRTENGAAARALATEFVEGFAGFGSRQSSGDTTWVKDRYLDSWATARFLPEGYVYGVRTAPDREHAERALQVLQKALGSLAAGGGSEQGTRAADEKHESDEESYE